MREREREREQRHRELCASPSAPFGVAGFLFMRRRPPAAVLMQSLLLNFAGSTSLIRRACCLSKAPMAGLALELLLCKSCRLEKGHKPSFTATLGRARNASKTASLNSALYSTLTSL